LDRYWICFYGYHFSDVTRLKTDVERSLMTDVHLNLVLYVFLESFGFDCHIISRD